MQPSIHSIRQELKEFFPETEIREFIKLIFYSLRRWSVTDMILRENEILSDQETHRIREIIDRLKRNEPIQYILGEVTFGNLILKLTPEVLIPRPETEELIAWIISSRTSPPSSILDIGTGSGCIALALCREFPDCDTEGCDISKGALKVAEINARQNSCKTRFFEADILNWQNYKGWKPLELIVSNPPYVMESEKKGMEQNVLAYEPGLALFVSDDDPLLFYRKIAEFAGKWLTDDGELFLEINRLHGKEIAGLLSGNGFRNSEIRCDLSGNPRMIRASR